MKLSLENCGENKTGMAATLDKPKIPHREIGRYLKGHAIANVYAYEKRELTVDTSIFSGEEKIGMGNIMKNPS